MVYCVRIQGFTPKYPWLPRSVCSTKNGKIPLAVLISIQHQIVSVPTPHKWRWVQSNARIPWNVLSSIYWLWWLFIHCSGQTGDNEIWILCWIWPWGSRSINQVVLHLWSKCRGSSLNGWRVIMHVTHTRTHTRTYICRRRQYSKAKTGLGQNTKHNLPNMNGIAYGF